MSVNVALNRLIGMQFSAFALGLAVAMSPKILSTQLNRKNKIILIFGIITCSIVSVLLCVFATLYLSGVPKFVLNMVLIPCSILPLSQIAMCYFNDIRFQALETPPNYIKMSFRGLCIILVLGSTFQFISLMYTYSITNITIDTIANKDWYIQVHRPVASSNSIILGLMNFYTDQRLLRLVLQFKQPRNSRRKRICNYLITNENLEKVFWLIMSIITTLTETVVVIYGWSTNSYYPVTAYQAQISLTTGFINISTTSDLIKSLINRSQVGKESGSSKLLKTTIHNRAPSDFKITE